MMMIIDARLGLNWVDAQEAEKAYNAKIAAEGVRRADAAEAARLAELERIRQRALQVRTRHQLPTDSRRAVCSPMMPMIRSLPNMDFGNAEARLTRGRNTVVVGGSFRRR